LGMGGPGKRARCDGSTEASRGDRSWASLPRRSGLVGGKGHKRFAQQPLQAITPQPGRNRGSSIRRCFGPTASHGTSRSIASLQGWIVSMSTTLQLGRERQGGPGRSAKACAQATTFTAEQGERGEGSHGARREGYRRGAVEGGGPLKQASRAQSGTRIAAAGGDGMAAQRAAQGEPPAARQGAMALDRLDP